MTPVTLPKDWHYGQKNYIEKLIELATLSEDAFNLLFGFLPANITSLSQAIKGIFDRPGIVWRHSYSPLVGGTAPPAYEITIYEGSAWDGNRFYQKLTRTYISMAGMPTQTYYVNLDSVGNPVISPTEDATSMWHFYWIEESHEVAALVRQVEILFSGEEFAYQLVSTARSKTFTSVGDRLEEIEQLLGRAVQTPDSADTIAVNWALGNHVRILLDRATTTINMTGGYDGQKCVLELVQDGTGGRAVVLGTGVQVGTDLSVPVPLSTDPDKRDFLGFLYGGNSKFNYVSLSRGY